MNSLVANYLVRLRVMTHVTTATMARLPVPQARGRLRIHGQFVRTVRERIAATVRSTPETR